MSIPQKIDEQMLADSDGSLDFVLMVFRFTRDCAHCSLERARV